MIERALRFVSTVATLIVIVGFAAFAIDQFGDASRRQQDELAGITRADPSSSQEKVRERRHGRLREAIDDANDILLKPFAGIVDSDSEWVTRLVPTILALLVYGFGLGYLARYARGWA